MHFLELKIIIEILANKKQEVGFSACRTILKNNCKTPEACLQFLQKMQDTGRIQFKETPDSLKLREFRRLKAAGEALAGTQLSPIERKVLETLDTPKTFKELLKGPLAKLKKAAERERMMQDFVAAGYCAFDITLNVWQKRKWICTAAAQNALFEPLDAPGKPSLSGKKFLLLIQILQGGKMMPQADTLAPQTAKNPSPAASSPHPAASSPHPAASSPHPAASSPTASSPTASSPMLRANEPVQAWNSPKVLALIKQLDQEHQTNNYLPIFYLRERLPLTREQQDALLFELMRSRQIRISALQEAADYTKEQFESGIPRDGSGPLFFIVVL